MSAASKLKATSRCGIYLAHPSALSQCTVAPTPMVYTSCRCGAGRMSHTFEVTGSARNMSQMLLMPSGMVSQVSLWVLRLFGLIALSTTSRHLHNRCAAWRSPTVRWSPVARLHVLSSSVTGGGWGSLLHTEQHYPNKFCNITSHHKPSFIPHGPPDPFPMISGSKAP